MYLIKCVFPLHELEQLCISQKGRKKIYGINIELIRGGFFLSIYKSLINVGDAAAGITVSCI